MQKYLYLILLSVLIPACSPGAGKSAAGGKRVLTVTIEPQRYLLDRIVGDLFTVNTLVPPATSPETYEPAPSVMVELGKSEIYFMVGDLGFENAWSKRLAENNPDVTLVNCSEGIALMEEHDHDHGHAHCGADPHVWSSPQAVKLFVRNMLNALVKADPGNAEVFRANFDAFSAKIERTDSLIRDLLRDAPSRSFIIYHPALAYFARDYGLHQLSIEFEGKSPSPSQIRELVDAARKEKINTVFIQRGFDTKNAAVVAQEVGAEVFEIDPLRYEWDEELLKIAAVLARKTDE
ncbi:MAG: zinc ABC transporter substrate-binding protein [Proteiniphilum sp.]|jgi:zinc transport system substrate-binding protein|nr:zinc ABC transporter substrate-binding protein [Proteiniphilum sp.]